MLSIIESVKNHSLGSLMNIAEEVIKKCGGISETAKITGRTPSVVYRWTYGKDKGGTGGTIPRDAAEKILEASARGEVSVTAKDFFAPQEGAA